MIVTGFENIEFFRDFHLIKKKNSHTICRFTAQNTRKNGAANYEINGDWIGKKVSVYAANSVSDKNDDNYIMTGLVNSIEFVSEYTEDLMTVTIVSNSVSLEKNTHIRVFQDTKKTVRDILEEIENKVDGRIVYLDSDLGRNEIEPIVLQYYENDKEFIEKMAKYMGTDVWYDDKSTDEFQIRLGDFRDGCVFDIKQDCLKHFSKTYSEKGITVRVAVSDYKFVNYMDIGQCFIVNGETFIIEEMNVYLNRQRFVYEFIGVCKSNKEKKVEWNEEFPTTSFLASVTSQDDPQHLGRIQVDFSSDGIESIVKDNPIWIDVETMYDGLNGGCIFIPDVGDKVDILFSKNQVFVLGVHRQEPLDEKYQNVSEKCIVDAKGRKIVFADDCLELLAENSRIQMNEQIIKIMNEDVVLQIEKGKISGKVSKSQFEINDDISIHSGNIHFDIDKNLEFKTSQSTITESRTVNITASGEVAITGKPVALNS